MRSNPMHHALTRLAACAALVALPACSLATNFDGYGSATGDGGGMDAAMSDAGDAATSDAEVDAARIDGGPDDATIDGGMPDARVICVSDLDCDDGIYCNGAELCMPDAAGADAEGCIAATEPRCAATATCQEDLDRCATMCDLEPDADGDGVTSTDCGGTDCNDSDASIRPGAPEICNEADDDCDTAVDEGVAATWYRDEDGDGYGHLVTSRVGCAMAGWTNITGDCDDRSAARNPGAAETCNGIDDDCDGMADEGVRSTFHRDEDGDGYGLDGVTMMACTAPSGFTNRGGDCADRNASVNPAASESCNLIDDDCDGLIDDGLCDFACVPATGGCDLPVQVASGFEFTCVRLESGAIYCVGGNGARQLGAGAAGLMSSTSWHRVTGLPEGIQELSAGGHHACVRTNAEILCWGGGLTGQLGNGTTADSAAPVYVSLPADAAVSAISAGYQHTCAILGGELHCWGNNATGQLGFGTVGGIRATPVRVSLPFGVSASAVSAGYEHTCAMTSGGIVCWGSNASGELGRGATGPASATPQAITGALDGSPWSISAGRWYSCAATTTTTYCWGINGLGQLGDGTTTSRSSPVVVSGSGAANYRFVEAGYQSTCAVRTGTGVVHCWGEGTDGALGHGSTAGSLVPVATVGLTNAQHISAAGAFACAMSTLSVVYCWGFNLFGQLGDGTTTPRLVPTEVDGPSP